MGNDGGSIRRRSDVVKVKKRPPRPVDPGSLAAAKWSTCAVSGKPLQKPIVSCELGMLYNREALCLYLARVLEQRSKQKGRSSPGEVGRDTGGAGGKMKALNRFLHIRGLRDVFPVQLHFPSEQEQAGSGEGRNGRQDTRTKFFSCPLSGMDGNGKYPFLRVAGCGCVLSQRALEQILGRKLHFTPTQQQRQQQQLTMDGSNGERRMNHTPPDSSERRKEEKEEEKEEEEEMVCPVCSSRIDTREGLLTPKDTAGIPDPVLESCLQKIPPQPKFLPIHPNIETMEGLRRDMNLRRSAVEEQRKFLKAVRKQLRRQQRKRKKQSSEAEDESGKENDNDDDGDGDGDDGKKSMEVVNGIKGRRRSSSEEESDRKRLKRTKKKRKSSSSSSSSSSASASMSLSSAARIAQEAERQAKAKMNPNLQTLFMSEEKRKEKPLFTSTAMRSPMSQL